MRLVLATDMKRHFEHIKTLKTHVDETRRAADKADKEVQGGGGGWRGRAVHLDPIKPKLKAPGIKLSKLKFDKPLSNFAFNFNLRRYSEGGAACCPTRRSAPPPPRPPPPPQPAAAAASWLWTPWQGLTLVHFSAQLECLVWDRECA